MFEEGPGPPADVPFVLPPANGGPLAGLYKVMRTHSRSRSRSCRRVVACTKESIVSERTAASVDAPPEDFPRSRRALGEGASEKEREVLPPSLCRRIAGISPRLNIRALASSGSTTDAYVARFRFRARARRRNIHSELRTHCAGPSLQYLCSRRAGLAGGTLDLCRFFFVESDKSKLNLFFSGTRITRASGETPRVENFITPAIFTRFRGNIDAREFYERFSIPPYPLFPCSFVYGSGRRETPRHLVRVIQHNLENRPLETVRPANERP